MEQIAIAFTGVIAIWLSQDSRASWRKWACIFGMVGQPFWFYMNNWIIPYKLMQEAK